MVEIFKTNISGNRNAEQIILRLQAFLPDAKINFDLEDSDRILRVERMNVPVSLIAQVVSELGYECSLLD